MAVATALVYMLAAVVSLLVFALTKLGEAVIFCAEITSKLKPELPDEAPQVRQTRRQPAIVAWVPPAAMRRFVPASLHCHGTARATPLSSPASGRA